LIIKISNIIMLSKAYIFYITKMYSTVMIVCQVQMQFFFI